MSSWTGKGDHKHWADAGNWQGGVPGAAIDADFGTDASVTLQRGTPLTTGALLLDNADVTLKGGTLNLAPKTAAHGNTFDLQLSGNTDFTVAAGMRLLGKNVAKIGNGGGTIVMTVNGLVAEEYGIVQSATLDISGTHAHWLSGDSGIVLESGTLVVENGGHLDTGGHLAHYPAAALDMDGNSSARISGAGSVVRVANAFVSTFGGTGSLTVEDGAQFYTGGGGIGGDGDGTLTVTGAGSLFQASRGVTIGGQVPVNSDLIIEDGGTVKMGRYGMTLNGTLTMDGSAHLITPDIVSGGAVIEAVSGTVTLDSKLSLYVNLSDPPETNTTFLEAAPGATLNLDGPIATVLAGSSALLEAASGHILLSHASHSFAGETGIYAATLEIAAPDAIGSSEFRFIAGAAQGPVLQIDAGIAFHNTIGGFASNDTIDLRGFAYDVAGFGFTSSDSGGTLTLNNAAHQHAQLVFSGTGLSAADFVLISDGNGGTGIIHS